ncbi:pyridoxamine 5'-phosphate oxidase family protein [Kordiimonas sp.]|uniref:pyridoxamine 5'-phosphate oxidase family protein n=1 Tax=Kordiimonas sp. TaxID=1970157 RepID=UPI003A94B413
MTEHKSPFHEGELAIQGMLGIADKVHKYASRGIRPFMPDQHRAFYEMLPHIFVGSLDAGGNPWASILHGVAGFMSSPTRTRLEIGAAADPDDPLSLNIHEGAEVGLLGLQFHSRRRNRVNGRISNVRAGGFSLEVTQSFGNCPKYIQKRETSEDLPDALKAGRVERRTSLTDNDVKLITSADTFFIASAANNVGEGAARGVDVSHRGGMPGFVKVCPDGNLLVPDFSGNRHFNTLGNILETGKAGLLFVDFEVGHLLQLTGSAGILKLDESPYAYEGAERFLRIRPELIVSRMSALPFTLAHTETSPFNLRTGGWVKR